MPTDQPTDQPASRPDQSTRPTALLVGRTNVGKSTLFNRLADTRRSLVSDMPGTTRDLNQATVRWRGREFNLIDSGGLDIESPAPADAAAKQLAEAAMSKADLILFVVDARDGAMPADTTIARTIRTAQRPVLVIANKAETDTLRLNLDPGFYELGFPDIIPVSARTGTGTGDLLDAMVERLATIPADQRRPTPARLAVIGRPNVGKSSLVNLLLGSDQLIVSPEPFTTRETRGLPHDQDGRQWLFLDTAGLRRPTRIRNSRVPAAPLEELSAGQSLAALRDADIVLLVLDVSEPFVRQDQRLAAAAIEAKTNVILVANKIDLIEESAIETLTIQLRKTFPMIDWAPIVFASATGGRGRQQILDLAGMTIDERRKRLSDDELEQFLHSGITKRHLPTKGKGSRYPSIKGFRQVATNPPLFELTIGARQDLHDSYLKYLEGGLRETFGFFGTPVTIRLKRQLVSGRQR